MDESSRIRSVEIKNDFPSGLSVRIVERMPSLIVCDPKCFVLDEKGEVYDEGEKTLTDEEKNDLVKITDESGKKIVLGSIFLDDSYINYVLNIKNKIKDVTGVEIQKYFNTPSFISNDIRLKTIAGWEIYFNESIDLEKELEKLKAVLKEKLSESQKADLEYIDLRIDNKIYYKFRDGTPSEEARLKALEVYTAPAPVITKDKKSDKKKEKD
jgi:cell division septal protein FtsQ